MQTSIPTPYVPTGDPRVSRLRALLTGVQKRLRLREAAANLPLALSLGLLATLALGIVSRVEPKVSLQTVAAAGLAMLVASALVVFAYAMLRPRDLMHTARRADLMLSLDERLSTALEDLSATPDNFTPEQLTLRAAQLDDALAAASRVDLARDLPMKVERKALLYPALLLAVLAVALFVPVPGLGPSEAQKAVARQVVSERGDITELKKALQSQTPAANDPARDQLNKELDQLLKDLQRDGLTREEALARLSQSEAKLEKNLDSQAPAQREALDQLSRQLSESQNSDLKEAGDALKSGDSQKAADALKKAAQNTPAMSPEDRKKMADTLHKAQGDVAPLDPQLAQQLNEAANALESNSPKAAQDALNNLSQQVQKTGQNLATQQQIEQALSQIQQSKSNIAQAGQPTPSTSANALATAAAQGQGTTQANGTPMSGTPLSGTPFSGTLLSGTAVASLGSPISTGGTPAASSTGTPVVLGSPVTGQLSATGTPVLIGGTPGNGTPVAVNAPSQGQGQPVPGSAPGQGQQPGSGQNPSQGNGQTGQNGQGGQSAPSSGWGRGHTDPVYVPPSSVNAPSTAVAVQGQNNPNGEQSSTTTNTDVNNTGPSQVPYEQVYGQYKDQAGRALNNDYIPQGYKDLVKDYFSSIEPGK